MFLKKQILVSAFLSFLLVNNSFATETYQNTNTNSVISKSSSIQKIDNKSNINSTIDSKINTIETLGSTIRVPLFFKKYKFLKIEIAKSFFNIKKNQSQLLLTVKNTSAFPFNFEKLLNIGLAKNNILKSGMTTKLIVSEDTFDDYLTEVSNAKFKKDKARIESLKNALTSLLNQFQILESQYISLKNVNEILKLEKSQILNNNNRLGNVIIDIINKFPKKSKMLVAQTVTGDKNADLYSLSLSLKTGILRLLINEQAEKLSNYMLNIKVSDILNELELVKTQSTILNKKILEIQPYIDSIKTLVFEEDNVKKSNVDILKEGILKLNTFKLNLDKKDEIIKKLKKELEKSKIKILTLKVENKRLNSLLKSETLANSVENLLKCQNQNRILNNEYNKILKNNIMLQFKISNVMKENEDLFKKYDSMSSTVDKLIHDKNILKIKIKKLQSLL